MFDKWEWLKRVVKDDIDSNERIVKKCVEEGEPFGVRRYFEARAEEAGYILNAIRIADEAEKEEGEKDDAV